MVDESKQGKSSHKIETLKAKGYLNEEGKVPKSVRQALLKNIRHSQNKEKSKGILGKITAEDGYIPNTDMGYTVLEYGAYHLAEECASEIKEQFRQAFGKGDNAKKIWVLALIYPGFP